MTVEHESVNYQDKDSAGASNINDIYVSELGTEDLNIKSHVGGSL